jgi:pyruvate formate lyase activating enzyme
VWPSPAGNRACNRKWNLFCRKAKNLGYKVKIDTNGTFPQVLQRLLEANLLDYVAVDVKTAPGNYATFLTPNESAGAKLAETLRLLAAFAVPHEARTTCVAPFVDKTAAAAMANLVNPAVPWFFSAPILKSLPQPCTLYRMAKSVRLSASLKKRTLLRGCGSKSP